jgi:putative peptide zinc metalloprotease protein
MRPARRFPALISLLLAALIVLAPPARADETPDPGDNNAIAVNTEDGASIFRLAFSVRMVANGVVDEDNHAWALASCTDCETVALAFQVVLVWNDPDIVVPHNQAVAYNEQCSYCLTYASATQIVLGFDGPVRFTAEGRQRLSELYRTLRSLEDRIGEMTPAELVEAVDAAKQELVSILSEELVRVPVPTSDPAVDATTTTVPAEATSESTTTATGTGSSSTTSAPTSESSTTTTASTASSPTSTTTATTTAPTTAPTTTEPPSTTTTAGATTTTTGSG